MLIFDPQKLNVFLHYAKLVTPCIQMILWAFYSTLYRKTNGIIGFLRSFCIRNMYLNLFIFKVFKFQNLTSLPELDLNFDFVYDKIRSNGIITVTFEFYVEIGP